MTIEFERHELRALTLLPIAELPPYCADFTAACRVGKTLTVHMATLPWNNLHQLNLERSLSKL
jgi:hypothetical protein